MDTIRGRPRRPPHGRLAGRYRLDALIGSGGMGHVYRARDLTLDRTVAVKVLPADLARDAEAVRRFGREARAVAGLNHPGIVTVFDAGVEDGLPYIVMEFVQGRTLAEVLRRDGRFEPVRAAAIAAAVADALAAAHARGVVHRDVKPGNVMLTDDGHVRVMDFGIALSLDADATLTRGALGTPTYTSPEQASGERVDARSDVYALGAVLSELLTGRPPFEASSPFAVLAMHREALPEAPSSRAPGIPPAMDAVVATALAKRPEDRFPSASAMAAAIRRAAGPRPASTVPQTAAASAAAVSIGAPTVRLEDDATRMLPAPAPRPPRGVFVALLAAAFAALLVVALIAWPGGAQPTAPSPTPPTGPVVTPSAISSTPGPKPTKSPKCQDGGDGPGCHGNGNDNGQGDGRGRGNGD